MSPLMFIIVFIILSVVVSVAGNWWLCGPPRFLKKKFRAKSLAKVVQGVKPYTALEFDPNFYKRA